MSGEDDATWVPAPAGRWSHRRGSGPSDSVPEPRSTRRARMRACSCPLAQGRRPRETKEKRNKNSADIGKCESFIAYCANVSLTLLSCWKISGTAKCRFGFGFWKMKNPRREKHKIPFYSRESDVNTSHVSCVLKENLSHSKQNDRLPWGQLGRPEGIPVVTEAKGLFVRGSRVPHPEAGLLGQGESFQIEKRISVFLETDEDLVSHLLMQGKVSLLKMSTTVSVHFGLDKSVISVRARATLGDFGTKHLAGESFELAKKIRCADLRAKHKRASKCRRKMSVSERKTERAAPRPMLWEDHENRNSRV